MFSQSELGALAPAPDQGGGFFSAPSFFRQAGDGCSLLHRRLVAFRAIWGLRYISLTVRFPSYDLIDGNRAQSAERTNPQKFQGRSPEARRKMTLQKKHIGNAILARRLEKNITAIAMAIACNVSRGRIYQWEKQDYILPKNFPIISKALDVPLRWLLAANAHKPRRKKHRKTGMFKKRHAVQKRTACSKSNNTMRSDCISMRPHGRRHGNRLSA